MNHQPWVAVDLDGTLAHFDTWKGIDHIGDPVPEMHRFVKEMLNKGMDVRIFTARIFPLTFVSDTENPTIIDLESAPSDNSRQAAAYIQAYCLKHFGRKLPITSQKDPGMSVMYDDVARQVVTNTGVIVGNCQCVDRQEDDEDEQDEDDVFGNIAHIIIGFLMGAAVVWWALK